ncbi:hypothetical protein MMC31_001799 [Peltigera leucophlebia]|nr:hypothetical protein [Peltigera leucophlebia]
MQFPFSFNGVATAIQNLASSYVGDTSNVATGQQQWARLTDNENIIDIAMDDASWFNLVPDLNHGQTHVDPHYGGDIDMNDTYTFIEAEYKVSDNVEKDMAMEDEPLSESREGLSMLSLEDDSGDETEVSMEDEPTSEMREALSAFTMGDPSLVPNLTPEDTTMGDSGSEPGVSHEALWDPLDAQRPSKRRRLLYQLTPPRRRKPGPPRRQIPAYMPMYTPRHRR